MAQNLEKQDRFVEKIDEKFAIDDQNFDRMLTTANVGLKVAKLCFEVFFVSMLKCK